MTKVKICGITDAENLRAALNAGADYVGLVFHPPSPRYIGVRDAAELTAEIPGDAMAVGLFVDPTDAQLSETLQTVRLGMIQLHGDEDPKHVLDIKLKYNLPVMKAIRLGGPEDLPQIALYEPVADWLLFDSKGGTQPGGTGQRFDWTLLQGRTFTKPWMLSGGLTAENVADALSLLHPAAVDVSSGVEKTRGVKDPEKIRDFINAVTNGGMSQ